MRCDASRIRSADISLSGAIATPHAPRPAVIPLRRPSDEGRPASDSARRPRRQARRTSTAWVGLSLSRSSSAHPPYPGVEEGWCAFERSRRADDHAGGELPARYLHAITSAVRARNGDAAGAWAPTASAGSSCEGVELRGVEPLTPSMRTRCATGLRHSPFDVKFTVPALRRHHRGGAGPTARSRREPASDGGSGVLSHALATRRGWYSSM